MTRASLQKAVDAAALAGAQAFCGGTGDPTAIAIEYGNANGVALSGDNVTVVLGSSSYINVRADATLSQNFSPLFDIDRVSVAAQATAKNVCNAGYAAFAGTIGFADNGGTTISGSLYSDGDTKFTSAANTVVDGSIDYVNACGGCDKVKLPDGTTTPANKVGVKTPRCYAYEIGLDRPGSVPSGCAYASGDGEIQKLGSGTIASCTIDSNWFTVNSSISYLDCGTNPVTISYWKSDGNLKGIKTTGLVEIDGKLTIGTATQPVILYSEAAGRAFEMKGSSELNMFGYLYAPQGEIYVGGSSNLSWTGTIIADQIQINGTGSGGGNVGFLARVPSLQLTQ